MSQASNVAKLNSKQQEDADSLHFEEECWPKAEEAVFHGLAGRYIRKIAPQTEADPMGILVQFLAMIGSLIGRGPHFKVEADEHHLNLFVVLVGKSAKGRKGVSAGQAKRLFLDLDSTWCEDRVQHGLSSGEGLIWHVRDSIEKEEPVREKGKPTGEFETVTIDQGIEDKRLLLMETEFASVLKVLKRDGNTLSAIIRNAWDGGRLSSLTKNSPACATDAHISIIGHITKAELLKNLQSTETANGFGNRFLWCCVKRSQFLPEGGQSHTLDFTPEIADLKRIIAFAGQTGEIRRDDDAREIWRNVYPELSSGKPGLFGSMIGRAEAQTLRIACLYALMDCSDVVRAEHLMAALALWDYCEVSTRWIFGTSLGDPLADEIFAALRASPNGMTQSEIGDYFNRHRKKSQLQRALSLLLDQGVATFEKEKTGGRPTMRWRACEKSEKSEKSELSP